jgi:hypothetical protein
MYIGKSIGNQTDIFTKILSKGIQIRKHVFTLTLSTNNSHSTTVFSSDGRHAWLNVSKSTYINSNQWKIQLIYSVIFLCGFTSQTIFISWLSLNKSVIFIEIVMSLVCHLWLVNHCRHRYNSKNLFIHAPGDLRGPSGVWVRREIAQVPKWRCERFISPAKTLRTVLELFRTFHELFWYNCSWTFLNCTSGSSWNIKWDEFLAFQEQHLNWICSKT